MPNPDERLQRFEVAENGCWTWKGSFDTKGRGRISLNRKWVQAHREIYQRLKGPIPSGLTLDHLCLNSACVNPDHLEPVTLAENVRRQHAEAHRSGRQNVIAPNAKLTPEQVLSIRKDGRSAQEIADAYGVSATAIHNIRSGRRWHWLTEKKAA